MSSSPPPEEREKKDAEDRAREKEEQAKLPYKWTQTIGDVDITVPIAGNLKARDLEVVFTKTKLKVAVKGQEAFIDVRLRNMRFVQGNTLTFPSIGSSFKANTYG